MNAEQEKAAKSLQRALNKCAEVDLGVYAWGDSIHVCPQPEGREHPGWDNAPAHVCDEIGKTLYTPSLDVDGGAGV